MKFNPAQMCNQPAPLADVKLWVAKAARRVADPAAAKRRIKTASKTADRCRHTPGCDATHHVMLATALRTTYSMGA